MTLLKNLQLTGISHSKTINSGLEAVLDTPTIVLQAYQSSERRVQPKWSPNNSNAVLTAMERMISIGIVLLSQTHQFLGKDHLQTKTSGTAVYTFAILPLLRE
jgi:hypothetical protein